MIKQLYSLLNNNERRQLRVLLVIMIIGALLDALGVAVFFPFIALLKDPNIIHNYPEIQSQLAQLGIESEKQLIISFATVLIVFFIFKNLFITYMNYKQFNFTYRSQVSLAQRLYKKYIENNYEFHIKTNTSVLLRNIKENSFWVFSSVLYPILIIVTEIFVVIFILAVLLSISPVITMIAVFVFLLIGYLFFSTIKNKSKYYGKKQQDSIKEMNKWITQGLAGIKDIKLHQNESYFIDKFSHYSSKYAANNVFQKTIDSLPKQLIETLLMVSIAISAIFIVNSGKYFVDILPIISLFAFSAIKLMPSTNRILSSLSIIEFYTSALDKIYHEFNNEKNSHPRGVKKPETDSNISFNSNIRLNNISYSYPESNQASLKDLSLSINKGDFIGIAGPSGCGKSTLVDILTGLLSPSHGNIQVDSTEINAKNMHSWQSKIGYIPQSVYLLDDTIKNNIVFGQEFSEINNEILHKSITNAGLKQHIDNLSEGIYTNIGEHGVKLSGGQKQRIGIARALYYNAEILVFDETTSALDAISEENIMNTINSLKNRTIIVITHRLSTIKSADKIFFIENGSFANAGTFDELLHSSSLFNTMANKS